MLLPPSPFSPLSERRRLCLNMWSAELKPLLVSILYIPISVFAIGTVTYVQLHHFLYACLRDIRTESKRVHVSIYSCVSSCCLVLLCSQGEHSSASDLPLFSPFHPSLSFFLFSSLSVSSSSSPSHSPSSHPP